MIDKEQTSVKMTPIIELGQLENCMIIYNKNTAYHGWGYIYHNLENDKLMLISMNDFPVYLSEDFIADNELYQLEVLLELDKNFNAPYHTVSKPHTLFKLDNDDSFIYFKTNRICDIYEFNTIKIPVGYSKVLKGEPIRMNYDENTINAYGLLVVG